MNALADADVHTLRISIDTKATVHVGEYSRGGRSRGLEAVKALDHDESMGAIRERVHIRTTRLPLIKSWLNSK